MNKYRIASSPPHGFKVEIKRWWWPFWCDITPPYLLGFTSQEKAKEWAISHSRSFVVEEIDVSRLGFPERETKIQPRKPR